MARLNYNFAKLDDEGNIIYAPSRIKDGNLYHFGCSPEVYSRLGWLPVIDVVPENDEHEFGRYWTKTGKGTVSEGSIVIGYEYVELEEELEEGNIEGAEADA